MLKAWVSGAKGLDVWRRDAAIGEEVLRKSDGEKCLFNWQLVAPTDSAVVKSIQMTIGYWIFTNIYRLLIIDVYIFLSGHFSSLSQLVKSDGAFIFAGASIQIFVMTIHPYSWIHMEKIYMLWNTYRSMKEFYVSCISHSLLVFQLFKNTVDSFFGIIFRLFSRCAGHVCACKNFLQRSDIL